MKISAHLFNSQNNHRVTVKTNERSSAITIPSKLSGFGSNINGGELLYLALATCFCNDLYREAAKRKIDVRSVEVDVEGDYGAEGAPSGEIIYRTSIHADASEEEILDLARQTDTHAEIQNTLRAGTRVTLNHVNALKKND